MLVPSVATREATGSDAERIRELFEASLQQIAGKRGEAAIKSATPDLWSDQHHLGVVEIEGVALGFCAARVANESELIVDWFYVMPDARQVGLGAALMNYVVNFARAKNCQRVTSVALPGDAKTKNFFESFGLKASLLTVGKELS